jgi:hypothetical protein
VNTPAKKCEGCDKPMGVIEALHWDVCLPCTKARHRAAVNRGRCSCGRQARRGAVCRIGSRSWVPCKRCLGTIEQLS